MSVFAIVAAALIVLVAFATAINFRTRARRTHDHLTVADLKARLAQEESAERLAPATATPDEPPRPQSPSQ
jgi:hypothetical protein